MTLADMFSHDEQGVENKIDVEHAQTDVFKYEAQAIDAWNKGKVEAER